MRNLIISVKEQARKKFEGVEENAKRRNEQRMIELRSQSSAAGESIVGAESGGGQARSPRSPLASCQEAAAAVKSAARRASAVAPPQYWSARMRGPLCSTMGKACVCRRCRCLCYACPPLYPVAQTTVSSSIKTHYSHIFMLFM